jgi:hypothetical protein
MCKANNNKYCFFNSIKMKLIEYTTGRKGRIPLNLFEVSEASKIKLQGVLSKNQSLGQCQQRQVN